MLMNKWCNLPGRVDVYAKNSLALIIFTVAVVAELFHLGDMIVFISAALAIIPLAGIMGEATEGLAEHTGPQVGGLLNASLGNAAELIITIVAISAGKLDLVKASIIAALVAIDGRSNWLEGSMLLAVYGILALAFFLSAGGVLTGLESDGLTCRLV